MACTRPLIASRECGAVNQTPRIYGMQKYWEQILKQKGKADLNEILKNPSAHLVPCGKCAGCRIDKKNEWTIRMEKEAEYYDPDEIYFVTLTYDDDHVPCVNKRTGEISRGGAVLQENGEVYQVQTLLKEDIQKFMKRLRHKTGYGHIRYVYSGEYGEQTARPHYHIILYGWAPTDLQPISKINKTSHFKSAELETIWGMGLSDIAPATPECFKYVAGYTVKKAGNNGNQTYTDLGMLPPYVNSSRMPGIGYQWISDHKDELNVGDMIQGKQGHKYAMPRYWALKLEEWKPEETYVRKVRKDIDQSVKNESKAIIYQTEGKRWEQQLETKERQMKKALKMRQGKL